jgi:hypothetical protein
MRLLKANTEGSFSLEYFIGNEIPRYAILSHRWEEDEVTYQDLVGNDSGVPKVTSKLGYKKIEFCGKQAKQDELEYFWVDSCCVIQSHHRGRCPT